MDATHERWCARSPGLAADEHVDDQCGACRFWIPLASRTGLDWGVCAAAASPFDGTARFEHDGCEHFVFSGDWATAETVR